MQLPYPTRHATLAVLLLQMACTPDSHTVAVSGQVELLANTPLVVLAPEALRTPYYVNALCIQPVLLYALNNDLPAGIVTPGKQLVRPTVRLRGVAGQEDTFDRVGNMGGSGGNWLCFEPQPNAKLHSPYSAVVLLSPSQLPINAIKWFSASK